MSPRNSFAKSQLSKHGWEEGQGLGKRNHGIKDAIKVKVKNNKNGLGHNQGEEFTFHWWDHIFNKAASSIEVSSDGDEVKIKKSNRKKVTPVLISNKKPSNSSYNGKPLLYGSFVKAGTMNVSKTDGSVESTDKSNDESSSDSDSSDDDDKYFGSDTLEKTFKMTGFTGHKAARHGHRMNGKLKRIQDQEETKPKSLNIKADDSSTVKMKTKYCKENSNKDFASQNITDTNSIGISEKKKKSASEEFIEEKTKVKKKKKKRKREDDPTEVSLDKEVSIKRKKKKKKKE